MPKLDSTELVIGDAPQFFFDNGMVAAVFNVTRTVHSPQKADANPVIQSDQSWEHVTYFSNAGWQLWHDVGTGRTHCLYEDWNLDRDTLVSGKGGTIHAWANARSRYLYAYSDDGVTWVKPPMGRFSEDGCDTNIVFGSEEYGSVHSLGLMEDPWDVDERRFKSLYFHIPPSDHEVGGGMVAVATSPDGINWISQDVPPVVGTKRAHLDDVAQLVVDPETRGYLAFTRHPSMCAAPDHFGMPPLGWTGGTPTYDQVEDAPGGRNRRRIFLSESSDFQHWSQPRLILAPDPEIDNFDTSFYGMEPYRVGSEWLGFMSVFSAVSNTMHVELTHSRDGRQWRRVAPGKPWLQPGPLGSWDQFMVNVSSPPVDVGTDELRVYFGGSKNHHDWWFSGPTENHDDPSRWDDAPEVADMAEVGYHLGLASLRRDGFVSLDTALNREGVVVTEPFVSEGDRLTINARCQPGGYIRVEVTDAHNRAIPGVSTATCDVFTGDVVDHLVTWQGRPDVPLAVDEAAPDPRRPGSPHRRLRFTMRGAELYSFQMHSADSAV